jgi:hypothetical protein
MHSVGAGSTRRPPSKQHFDRERAMWPALYLFEAG